MKMKLTLAYKPSSGFASLGGIFKNTHLHIQLPDNVYTEQTMFKFESLNFSGGRSSTPPVI
jgi:hypothetical protein